MFDSVIILTDNETHAKRDKQSVLAFGPRVVRFFDKGSDAFDYLSRNRVDIIFCDSALADMDGVRFLRLLRQNMNLTRIPVVMVTLENRKTKVLDCISAGCAGYILRPYSMETFERHVKLALNVEAVCEIEEIQLEEARDMVSRGEFDDAIEAYEEVLSGQDEARKYYDMGCSFLFKRKYGKAIIAFKKAVKINALFAEAYKGLADAYKGKGDFDNYKLFLKKAAETHAQFDRLEETKELFIEILKYESGAPNPFNTLGVRLRREGDNVGALHAYDQAVKLTPEDENVYFNMSKAHYFMGNKGHALSTVRQALTRNPAFLEARKLYSLLTGEEWSVPALPSAQGQEARRRSESVVDDD
ncbi:response regulator receiver protein [Desulfovibrio sp. X2]|uniref:response regulator n=1 Tax=Desulfovibrio sp. X2 TaxID=941449 RepID=UPI000358C8CD|nr:response regulator [Desulfovibrio sp. X2]EPR42682.1 response regulator receiver protein [Desulfovibrio sp. X2]